MLWNHRFSTIFATLFTLAFLTACSVAKPSPSQSDEAKSKTVELQKIMHQFNQSMQSNEHQNPLELEDSKRRNALKLARTISTLADQVDLAVADYPAIKNDPASLSQYRAYVQALKQHGSVIQQLADSYQIEKIQGAIQQLNQTCTSCHTQFRNRM